SNMRPNGRTAPNFPTSKLQLEPLQQVSKDVGDLGNQGISGSKRCESTWAFERRHDHRTFSSDNHCKRQRSPGCSSQSSLFALVQGTYDRDRTHKEMGEWRSGAHSRKGL